MGALFEISNIISFGLRYYCLHAYMNAVFEKKFKGNFIQNQIIMLVYYVATTIGFGDEIIANIFEMVLINFIYVLLNYKGKFYKILIHAEIWNAIILVCECFVLFGLQLRYSQEMFSNPKIMDFGMVMEWVVFTFVIIIISKILRIRYNGEIGKENCFILIFLAAGTLIVDYGVWELSLHSPYREDGYYALFISVIMIVMSIIIIKIYEGLGERAHLETENTIYQRQADAYRMQIHEREETQKEFRRLKHDMKNHLIYMDELICQNRGGEAHHYIQEMLESRGMTSEGTVNSGNILIDGLINYKISYMNAQKINFHSEVVIPLYLKIPEDSFCIILGNLLDNAIEGTQKLNEGARNINLQLTYKRGNLILLIENSCLEEELVRRGDRFLTTKKEKGHGMGLDSVRRAVEECNGDICLEVDEGVFRVSVILPGMQTDRSRE